MKIRKILRIKSPKGTCTFLISDSTQVKYIFVKNIPIFIYIYVLQGNRKVHCIRIAQAFLPIYPFSQEVKRAE